MMKYMYHEKTTGIKTFKLELYYITQREREYYITTDISNE